VCSPSISLPSFCSFRALGKKRKFKAGWRGRGSEREVREAGRDRKREREREERVLDCTLKLPSQSISTVKDLFHNEKRN